MLATLTEDYFSDPSWVFEPKLDGVRCLAFKDGPRVRLLSRNRLPLNERYPEIARAISSIEHDQIVLDGEAAVVSSGITRFQSLQRHLLQDAPLDASSFSPSISCTSMGTTSRGSRC